MNSYRIALYPGDGIGVDVTHEAVKVLRAAEGRFGFHLDCTEYPWGCQYAREHDGAVVPSDFLDVLRKFNAIFLGAVGYPELLPDHITLTPLIQIRQTFEQYICLRPAKLLPGVETPLANKKPGDIDMLIVRENSEGEYFRAGGAFRSGKPEEVAVQTAVHSRKGVSRIIRYGFERASRRSKRLAVATKSNALNFSMVLWDRILQEIAEEYPEVEANRYHIDALTMLFVREPERFDVVVGSNLFAEILSDLAGALVGSLGLAPSANLNPDGDFPSLFEPVHGSAPDIAGQGIANPVAAVRSAAMMLEFLGEIEASRAVEESVVETLREGQIRTPDLGGSSSTGEVGDELARRVAGFLEIWWQMRFEALLFDVFGTVVDWRGSIARQAAAEFSDIDPASGGDWSGFADAWRRGYQPAMEEVRSGRRPFVPLDVLHREILESVAGEFGLAGLPAERLDRMNRFWHALEPWPDSVAGMIRLRRRFVLAAHSNGNVALMVDMARHASLPWDMILGAEVTGYYKPMPQSYLRAAEMLGLAPDRCMMVAAHNRDLVAASSCGLRTAFIPRPEEHGPGQATDLAPTGDWDICAECMEDLASQLDL